MSKRFTKDEISDFGRDMALMKDATLKWIYGQIYDPADAGMKSAIERIFWERGAIGMKEWPAYRISTYDAPAWVARLGRDHLVDHCPKGNGPQDPQHRPVRENPLSSEIECSCGRITKWDFMTSQRYASALVWPTELIDGVPHFVVCSKAAYADDPAHAPLTDVLYTDHRCACRWTLDPVKLAALGLSLKKLACH